MTSPVLAYEAYRRYLVKELGHPMEHWEGLSETIRGAWRAAVLRATPSLDRMAEEVDPSNVGVDGYRYYHLPPVRPAEPARCVHVAADTYVAANPATGERARIVATVPAARTPEEVALAYASELSRLKREFDRLRLEERGLTWHQAAHIREKRLALKIAWRQAAAAYEQETGSRVEYGSFAAADGHRQPQNAVRKSFPGSEGDGMSFMAPEELGDFDDGPQDGFCLPKAEF